MDDTTSVECIPKDSVIRHIGPACPTKWAMAIATEDTMGSLVVAAEDIGMRINVKKTQCLCVSNLNGFRTWSSITVGGEVVRTTDTMKLLGFILSADGSMDGQVLNIKMKFRARFWSLIHLKRAGITDWALYRIFSIFIRPAIETNCVIYHPMINRTQEGDIERLHKQVLRLCFGPFNFYADQLLLLGLSTLEKRREAAVRKFVGKATKIARFQKDWFKPRLPIGNELRSRRPYLETQARTNRYFQSPLLYYQRTANNMYTR